MAKNKNKHYIDIASHKEALKESRMSYSEVLHMIWVVTLNISLGVGEERFMNKVLPVLCSVGKQYEEWCNAGGAYYGKVKLLQATNEVLKKAPFELWVDKFILDDGEVL